MTDIETGTSGRRGRRRLLTLIVGLSPLWLLLYLVVVDPGFLEPLGRNSVSLVGLPLGMAMIGTALLLSLAGAFVIWRASSKRMTGIALLVLIVPALTLVVFGPAIYLIIENMGAS